MSEAPSSALAVVPAPTAASLATGAGWARLSPGMAERLRAFLGQPAVRRALPAMAAGGALTLAGGLWLALSDPPQRTLYEALSDAERGQVAAALEAAGISYRISHDTGLVTVAQDDLYRARMTVASNGSLSSPETHPDPLADMPLGASRVLETEKVRLARERELMLTIRTIDGVEAVRVHLAMPERSVFVREQVAPSASVMIRLARGRSLSPAQIDAVAALVAGAVPGLPVDAVRIADQSGRLLSRGGGMAPAGLDEQAAREEKLRLQLDQLLLPLVGEGNFSVQAQVELDRSDTTRAQESYDRDGVVRSESETRSQQPAAPGGLGIPGALSNTPPPDTTLDPAPPAGNEAPAAGALASDASARREFAIGRAVSVASSRPGGVRRISVAVALNAEALKQLRPAGLPQVKELVAAAAGADPARGDTVTVVAGTFSQPLVPEAAWHEQWWAAPLLRHAAALVAVLLVLLLVVRPLVKRLTPASTDSAEPSGPEGQAGVAAAPEEDSRVDHPGLARTLASTHPAVAADALRRLLHAQGGRAA
ncbi:flagellar M-ring protein FliF [Erythrobacteraceae bacterium CFH 75059]|uniref:flagellar basal-body MS-ring/collar protein FliF n=1 Tax=Qipengyuania thermophila TaxID=2509361 RepID=UPI001020EFF7|nr:flagellar basal-body MS-ring/collar protein FliF [Qipengyuania thermophila]TCD06310.1 flagellar M-ring protein FliF [Erythrobacteraceae bacterium CFH 75059]